MFLCYTGPHTVCSLDRFRTSSVGTEIPGVQTKLADKDEEGNGEVGSKYMSFIKIRWLKCLLHVLKVSCHNRPKR